MIDLLYWSFVAALLPPFVLDFCVKILLAAAGALVGRSDRPVVLNRHPHFSFRFQDSWGRSFDTELPNSEYEEASGDVYLRDHD